MDRIRRIQFDLTEEVVRSGNSAQVSNRVECLLERSVSFSSSQANVASCAARCIATIVQARRVKPQVFRGKSCFPTDLTSTQVAFTSSSLVDEKSPPPPLPPLAIDSRIRDAILCCDGGYSDYTGVTQQRTLLSDCAVSRAIA